MESHPVDAKRFAFKRFFGHRQPSLCAGVYYTTGISI
jgi:hypothetical protein